MAAGMAGPGTSYPDLVYTMPLTDEKYVVGFRKGSNLVDEPTRALDSEMEGGKIVEQGTSKQIFDNPKSKRLKDFLKKVL